MRYDGRNPYGSKGGYVRDGRMDYNQEDMRRDYRGRMDYNQYDNRDYRQSYDRNYEEDGAYDEQYARYDGGYYYPFELRGNYGKFYQPDYRRDYEMGNRRDYRRDYGKQEKELKKHEEMLLSMVDEKDMAMIKKETIFKRAEDMGLKFEDFSKEEFYLTFLLMFTTFHKTLGTSNIDVYVKMANTWLASDDTRLQYGDKLTAYFETIVEGK